MPLCTWSQTLVSFRQILCRDTLWMRRVRVCFRTAGSCRSFSLHSLLRLTELLFWQKAAVNRQITSRRYDMLGNSMASSSHTSLPHARHSSALFRMLREETLSQFVTVQFFISVCFINRQIIITSNDTKYNLKTKNKSKIQRYIYNRSYIITLGKTNVRSVMKSNHTLKCD